MLCTTASLCSATAPSSARRSAQSSHIFLVLPSTFTLFSSSASFPQLLHVAIVFSFAPGPAQFGPADAPILPFHGQLSLVKERDLPWSDASPPVLRSTSRSARSSTAPGMIVAR